MLFDINDANYHIAWSLIFAMSAITVIFFFMIFSLAVRSHKRAIITGQEGLIGSEGVVLNAINGKVVVRVLGEIWNADTDGSLKEGDSIKVTGIRGLTLVVKSLKKISR